ncbi:MAG TPA: tRNA (guanosine(46)-N7)-methyltransferase TrmB [Candidatus Acidoferrales bacterium]|nr:tRNA (guanosine(46)-N7)-methyltransferase TrmB [Candidatus Acidoferrales bacterium]
MHELWRAVFGNDLPVEVEIGPGTGTFILAAAPRAPQINFFGIEHSHNRAARLALEVAAQGLCNVRALAADATCIVSTIIPAASVAAYHIYFPDPWWKRRHHRRRLFAPAFGLALARTLIPRGRIHFATDVEDVFQLAVRTLLSCVEISIDPAARSPRPYATVFERKGVARGAAIREATFVKGAASLYTSRAAPMTPAESPS